MGSIRQNYFALKIEGKNGGGVREGKNPVTTGSSIKKLEAKKCEKKSRALHFGVILKLWWVVEDYWCDDDLSAGGATISSKCDIATGWAVGRILIAVLRTARSGNL